VIMDRILLIAMLLAALWTVMTRSLLKAALGLAVTSAIISILMFRLDSPLAAVFELSVCAGLITAVFISAISLMKPLTHKETLVLSKQRIKRYWYLPVIMIVVGIALTKLTVPVDFKMPLQAVQTLDVRNVLWNSRPLDLLGQVVILLAGVFGIVILFKEFKETKNK
jgi:NADH-quinone oxidoreductase subunit J